MTDESKSLMKMLNNLAPSLREVPIQQQGTTMNIINEREKTHGPYRNTAAWSQSLKDMFRSSPNWGKMNDQQKESLEMIASKLARLLNGDHNHPDHPVDISGYADLYAMNSEVEISAEKMVANLAQALNVSPSNI
jgi:hypothetical protein